MDDMMAGLSAPARQAFLQALVPAFYDAQAFLIHAGEVNGNAYYLRQGLVRFVYHSEDGKEFNKSFATEGAMVGCLRSMLTAQACRFSIQALEPTDTLFLSHERRLKLYREFPECERLARVQAEQLALKKEAREAEFLLDDAETRYRSFLLEYPGLATRIPQYHIASYLGITDVALSRIRGKMKSA